MYRFNDPSVVPYFTTAAPRKRVQQQQQKQQRSHRSAKLTSATRPRATVETTVRYLGVCGNPAAYRSVVRAAPDSVVKTICNAALNVERGDVRLSSPQKTLFRKHRQQIHKLTNRRTSLVSKRRVIEQRGGAFWIPALIGAAISSLAGSLFGGNRQQ